MAIELGCGFVPVRKPGKLPAETVRADYELEYGTDTLEMHVDAVSSEHRILLVDDLLATGGTMGAVLEMAFIVHREPVVIYSHDTGADLNVLDLQFGGHCGANGKKAENDCGKKGFEEGDFHGFGTFVKRKNGAGAWTRTVNPEHNP